MFFEYSGYIFCEFHYQFIGASMSQIIPTLLVELCFSAFKKTFFSL